MNNQYYGLVSGLHQIVASKSGELNFSEFKDSIVAQLQPRDHFQFLLLFYPYDNLNFLNALNENEDKEGVISEGNVYPFELENIIKNNFTEDLYFQKYLDKYPLDLSDLDLLSVEKTLSQHYYDFVQKEGIPFLKEWAKFELTMKNLTAIHTMRKLDLETDDLLEGGLFTLSQLKRINLSDLDKEFPYLKRKFETLDLSDPIQRKKTAVEIKWDYLDHLTFFNYFGIERILGHTIKMRDVYEWQQLDPDIGRSMLKDYLNQIDKELESKLA